MNLRYSGKLTKEEYLAYVKLNARPVLKKNSSFIDLWVVFVFIGGFFSLVGAAALLQGDTFRSGSYPWQLPVIIAGIIIIGLGLKFRGTISKYWEENKESLSNFDGLVSDDNVEIYTPNGNLKLGWPELTGYGEYRGLIVLYKTPMFAVPFLERFFEKQEDWRTFREIVVKNLVLSHRADQGAQSGRRRIIAYTLFIISVIIMLVYLYFLKGG